MNHRLGIEDEHVELAIRAYCEERKEIVIPWNSYFHSDPFDTLNRNRDLGFVVDVDFPMGEEYWKHKETAKLQVQVQWENLR